MKGQRRAGFVLFGLMFFLLWTPFAYAGAPLTCGGEVLQAGDGTSPDGGTWRAYKTADSANTAEGQVGEYRPGFWAGEVGHFMECLEVGDELLCTMAREEDAGTRIRRGYYAVMDKVLTNQDPASFAQCTLRAIPVPNVVMTGSDALLTWEEALEDSGGGSIVGYNIHRSQDGLSYVKVNGDAVSTTSYTDSGFPPGTVCYALELVYRGTPPVGGGTLSANSQVEDTDNDGIPDNVEDANHNGEWDPGEETDFNSADTDGDGVQDGTESGVSLEDLWPATDQEQFQEDEDPATTTDPLNPDTDGDGITDGQEDSNQNGRVDAGETDPTSSDRAFDATSAEITHSYMPLEPHQKRTYAGSGSYSSFGRYLRAIGPAEVDGVECQRVQVKGHGYNADPDADAEWNELWLAQDTRGVVWLLQSYDAQSDTTTTYGQAGAILWMPLNPVPGQIFRDRGAIYSELAELGIEVPALGTGLGPYPGSWKVLENPGPEENVLYYAPGVGCVMEEWNRGGVANGWELSLDQVYPPGDHNEDCSVDGLDFLIFRDDWASTGCCEPSVFCPGDLNFDGTVDGLDFLIFRDHWSWVCD